MPKKKPGMTPEEQSEKFKALARELETAGELSPIDADERFDRVLKIAAPARRRTPAGKA